MEHLANISQFEQIQNSSLSTSRSSVWNDNEKYIPDSYKSMDHRKGPGVVMGSGMSAAKPNVPKLPEWGARNSLGDILLSLQDRLGKYLQDTRKETENFASDIKNKTGEIGLFLSFVKHPAARERLGLGKKDLKGLSKVVRDFYSSFQKQIYDAVYAPLSKSCETVTDQLTAKGPDVPSKAYGFNWFGLRPTVRSEYLKRLKDAKKKGDLNRWQYLDKRLRKGKDADWQNELFEQWDQYRDAASRLLQAQRNGGTPISPELKKVMEMYGFDAGGRKKGNQGEAVPDALRAILGEYAEASAANDFFSEMGTQKWKDKHHKLLGKLRGAIPGSYRQGKGGGKDKQDTQQKPKQNGDGGGDRPEIIIPQTADPSLRYSSPGDFLIKEGFDAAKEFISDIDQIKSHPDNKGKLLPDRVYKFYKGVKSDLKNAEQYRTNQS